MDVDRRNRPRKMTRGGGGRGQSTVEDDDFDRGPAVSGGNRQLFDSRLESSTSNAKKRNNNNKSHNNNGSGNGQGSVGKFRQTEYNLASLENLVNEIQKTYFDITGLEDKCEKLATSLQEQGDEECRRNFEDWNILYSNQSTLLQKYYDFLFLTNHPYGNSATKSLIKKYKIPLRMWNKGIFKFLDLLRNYRAHTHDLIAKFTLDCFSLLTMLTDPPYESRNMWLEALGDISRFSMILGPSTTADWKKVAQFWYQKAMVRSPGVGRLYHHSAVVCTHRLDSLFYFCKSLTATQPFSPAADTIGSLFKTNALSVDTSNQTGVFAFLSVHQELFNDPTLAELSNVNLSVFLSELSNEEVPTLEKDPDHVIHRGFAIAACNISALMDYGINQSNWFWGFFNHDHTACKKESPASRKVAFQTLRTFLLLPIEIALPHALVWLMFLHVLADDGDLFDSIVSDSQFPKLEFDRLLQNAYTYICHQILNLADSVQDINQLIGLLAKWKGSLNDKYPPSPSGIQSREACDLLARTNYNLNGEFEIPTYKKRPLPEETELYGFMWPPKSPDNSDYVMTLELGIPNTLFPGFSNTHDVLVMRPIRAIELIYEIAKSRGWTKCGPSSFFVSTDELAAPLLKRIRRPLLPEEYSIVFPEGSKGVSHCELDNARWVFDVDIWMYYLDQVHKDSHLFAHIDVPLITIRQLKYCAKEGTASDSANAVRSLEYIVEQHHQDCLNIFTSARQPLEREDIVEHADNLDSCHPGGYINVPDVFLEFLVLSQTQLKQSNQPLVLLSNNRKMMQRALAQNIICVHSC
jgi:hypothetical protein